MKLNEHTFFLAQDIFIRGFTESEMKGDIPQLACVAINAAHEFMGVWDTTQEVLEGQSKKAVEASTAIAAKKAVPAKAEPAATAKEEPASKTPAPKTPAKQKRRRAAK